MLNDAEVMEQYHDKIQNLEDNMDTIRLGKLLGRISKFH
jgi:hypothetical protein